MTGALQRAGTVARKSLLVDRRTGEALLVLTPFGAVVGVYVFTGDRKGAAKVTMSTAAEAQRAAAVS